MNEEKKVTPTSQSTMQDTVQQMLPDDLKKQFVFQKNGAAAQDKPAQRDASATPPAEQLDPNLVQKSMRTFETDLQEALKRKQGSSASISIAESKKKEELSRQIELAQKKSAPSATHQSPEEKPVRPGPAPVAPTRATAIPGATISLPPTMQGGEFSNSISSEIETALRANNQIVAGETPQPTYTPPQSYDAPAVPRTTVVNVPPTFEGEPRHSILKPILVTLISLVLIGSGVFVGYYYFTQVNIHDEVVSAPQTPVIIQGLIPYDMRIELDSADLTETSLISKIYAEFNKSTITAGKNLELSLTRNTTGTAQQISGPEFLQRIGANIPEVMNRSLTDRWMLGVYAEDSGQKTTYMALTTDFFQNAFAGMLMWEDTTLADDLALVLNYKQLAQKDNLSTTTPNPYFGIRGNFSDRVLRNRDVREFRSQRGDLLFLYSFINKGTLLITTTESSFNALIDRIEKDAYVR